MSELEVAEPTVEVEAQRDNPNIIVRILWFVLVGWWLGFWAIVAGYLCLVLIIPAPIGVAILDRLPRIMTLRAPARTPSGDHADQRSWLIRIPWLLLVGWWLGILWLSGAYLITLLTFGLGLPISFWMFNRAASVITLYRG